MRQGRDLEFYLGGADGIPRVDFYGVRRRETLDDIDRWLRKSTGEPSPTARLEVKAARISGRTLINIGLSTRPDVKVQGVLKRASASANGAGDQELTIEHLNGAQSDADRLQLGDGSEVDGIVLTRELILYDEPTEDWDIVKIALKRSGLIAFCQRPIEDWNPSGNNPEIVTLDPRLLALDQLPSLKVLVGMVQAVLPQYSADRIRKSLMAYGLWRSTRVLRHRRTTRKRGHNRAAVSAMK